MAETDTTLKVKVNGEDNTKEMFQSLGKNLGAVQTSSSSLSSGLAKLGMAGAALYAGHELLNFLEQSMQKAIEDAEAVRVLTAEVNSLGESEKANTPAMQDYVDSMVKYGQESSVTENALTQLIRVTGDVNAAIYLSQQASDLAASGMGDYASNVDALSSIFTEKYRQAGAQFNVDMKQNTTAAEVLSEAIGKITTTTADAATYNEAHLKEMQTQWQEFTGKVGSYVLDLAGTFAEKTNEIIDNFGTILKVGGDILMGDPLKAVKDVQDAIAASQEKATKDAKEEQDSMTKGAAAVQDKLKAIQAETDAEADQKKAADDAAQHLKDEQSAFRDFSKQIVSDVDDQAKSIQKLQDQMDDLDSSLADDLAKSNDAYQADVVNLARNAQQKADDLDKQIADEQATMSAGWRTRVAELQAEKQKEQDIITKAGTQVNDLSSKLAEDDLQQLQDKHAKEVADLQDTEEQKKLLLQKEQLTDTVTMLQDELLAKNPDYYKTATASADTFLGAIGGTPTQQSIVFNFNGAVAGDDGIKKIITDTIAQLNRNAQLKNVGAK